MVAKVNYRERNADNVDGAAPSNLFALLLASARAVFAD